MTIQSWARQYAKKHKFEFHNFNGYQFRVKNGDKFVDFWTNGSCRLIDGTFFRVGSTRRGFGVTTDTNEVWGDDIKNEIKKLKN